MSVQQDADELATKWHVILTRTVVHQVRNVAVIAASDVIAMAVPPICGLPPLYLRLVMVLNKRCVKFAGGTTNLNAVTI